MQLTLQPINFSYPNLAQLKSLVFNNSNKNATDNRKIIAKPKSKIEIIVKKIL